ncbi:MAG TPA: tRNA (N(6)-L-threonylcarbamoyladenosine(37)-C(2))-methylthiotransferase MtaB [Desulfopila sp.]|nr:tRNA (N(6)-L-threonylcarbamoyladenosine(37)-C(2))-methylthiotransferase MtaB [Desulfopila sp.]
MKKVAFTTFGCKVNQYETASFISGFQELGYAIESAADEADIVVINTCAVTAKAGSQSRQTIRRTLRRNRQARVVITGCYAQLAAQEISAMEELEGRSFCIIGNADKHDLIQAATAPDHNHILVRNPADESVEISPLPLHRFKGRTRAYLRIQDGCNAFCSYCIVPYTRGRSRSLSSEEILRQADIFIRHGYREIVVTGIHVGNYGADLGEKTDIADIMNRLCRMASDVRFRLSSIEPLEISEKLIESIVLNNNFMPHLHIPLQSGVDDILLRMNRRYSTSRFKAVLETCRNAIEDVAVGLDILAGFPGETDNHFSHAYSFLEELEYTYLHVFPYSRRPGTAAADFDDQVPRPVKNERVARLRNLGEAKKLSYYRKYIGRTRKMLVENARDASGMLKGFTDNYIPVQVAGEDILKNQVVDVELLKIHDRGTYGSVLPK